MFTLKPEEGPFYFDLCHGIVVSRKEVSLLPELSWTPKTRLAAIIWPGWHPNEVRETAQDEWFTAWRKRITRKWDGKNPIVKVLREMRRERVGVRRGRSVGKAPRQRPLTKHKWK